MAELSVPKGRLRTEASRFNQPSLRDFGLFAADPALKRRAILILSLWDAFAALNLYSTFNHTRPNGERKVMETLQSVFGIDVQTVLFRALEQGSIIITLELNRTDATWLANQKPLLDWCLTQIGNGWEIREWPSVFANEESPDGVLIRIVGKGSYHNSPALKSYVTAKIDEERRDFVIDLNNCPRVDSTFVGTLMGIALQLARTGGRIWLIR